MGLSDFVSSLITVGRYSPGDFLILTPRRLLGYRIRDLLKASNVPVHSFYHEEALEGLDQGTLSLPNVADLITKFRELLGILANLKDRELTGIVDALMPANNDECSVLREAAILALRDVQGVADLFEALKTHVTQPEMPEQGNFVRVMSLHKSKGLTSKVAIIAGCIHGLIPFVDPDEPPKEQAAILAEQRRLFYVAITRCTDVLVLSSVIRMERKLAWKIGAQLKPGQSSVGATIASRFIHELGPSAPLPLSGQQWKACKYML